MTTSNEEPVLPSFPSRILCVDDDAFMRKLLETMLSELGFTARIADSVRAALTILHSEKIDLVLTDQQMPRLSGLDLLEMMREEGLDTPVILLTGFGSIEQAVTAVRAGAAHYLTKPVDRRTLGQLIADVLEVKLVQHDVALSEAPAHPPDFSDPEHAHDVPTAPLPDTEVLVLSGLDVAQAERQLILRALERTRNNYTAAAALLGMHPRTLRRKLKDMNNLPATSET